MVGPISREERTSFALRFKLAGTALVAISGGLIALRGDASLPFILLAMLLGAIAGAALMWFVFPGTGETRQSRRRR